MRLSVLLSALATTLAAPGIGLAAEYPLDIKTDLTAKFYVVERGGTADYPTLVVKRVRIKGSPTYTKRAFDCRSHTVQTLGSGATIEEMAKSTAAPQAHPIKPGSISAQLWEHACKKK